MTDETELTGVMLSRDPIIIHAAGGSFESIVSPTMELYRASGRRAHYLLSATLGLATRTVDRERLAREASALRGRFPDVSMTLLVNDVAELTHAWQLGIDTELVNGGCFVDEYLYTIDPTCRKRFDAVCDLRAASPERHRLAESIASVVLLAPAHTDDSEVAGIINTANCALCLSQSGEPAEAIVEYLLCGVPIVTTHGLSARDWWLTDDIAIHADDTQNDVAAAVARMSAYAVPPVHVRQTALQRIRRERAIFFGLLDQVFAAHGQPARRYEAEFSRSFTHRWHEQRRKLSAFVVSS
jgi:hypothetical protein